MPGPCVAFFLGAIISLELARTEESEAFDLRSNEGWPGDSAANSRLATNSWTIGSHILCASLLADKTSRCKCHVMCWSFEYGTTWAEVEAGGEGVKELLHLLQKSTTGAESTAVGVFGYEGTGKKSLLKALRREAAAAGGSGKGDVDVDGWMGCMGKFRWVLDGCCAVALWVLRSPVMFFLYVSRKRAAFGLCWSVATCWRSWGRSSLALCVAPGDAWPFAKG